jgi:hypothetical protein
MQWLVTSTHATHLPELHKIIVNKLITQLAPTEDYRHDSQPLVVDGVHVVLDASTLHDQRINSHIPSTL